MPLLRHTGFEESFNLRLKNPKDKFTREEIKFLKRHGTWLYHLMCGTTSPVFPNSDNRDAHFVKVFREKVTEPNNKREYLWKRYLLALNEEEELKRKQLEEFRESPEFKNPIKSLWLGEVPTVPEKHSTATLPDANNLNQTHTVRCPICRGSGMKGNGDNCDRCNGRGEIV
jgi:uncharacterized protein YifE (UPF0438 family)